MTTGTIRPQPPEKEEDNYEEIFDLEKLYKESWEAYKKAFGLQRKIQEKEIGCYLPIDKYGSIYILTKAISMPDKTPSGIWVPENVKEDLVKKYNIGLVIGIGPEAFRDRKIFPGGPRCKIGDWVNFSPFDKVKQIFNDHLCHFITDDKVITPIYEIPSVVSELRKYK
jgi:co-chaperonin GroES (HSP10)